ncbi:MAG TPA: hydroxysqualene dehydroxylase HpnE [Pirellulales bacterium]|nr:hydroxysqualene dehydroxylase HpnE [Pirellulales bacterium]
MSEEGDSPPLVIVGGGLAGLAATVGLAERGLKIELYEAHRRLGGRATSFFDSASGEWIDHCQHVGMGCCTNLSDFCRRTGLAEHFRRDRVLRFFGPDGRCHRLTASRGWPAPAHLAPSLWQLKYLSVAERIGIGRAMLHLARSRPNDDDSLTVGAWLHRERQSPRAIDLFWSVVLVSALGEELDRASLVHARKVFVDGFLAAREAYEIDVPCAPLNELYGKRLQAWLEDRGIRLRLGCEVRRIGGNPGGVTHVELADGSQRPVAGAIVAVTWRRVRGLFEKDVLERLPELSQVDQIDGAPITGVHLWFDRPITSLPHAVLVGRLSQWMFNRGTQASERSSEAGPFYYQVVISASRSLAGRDRESVVAEIVDDLAGIWPAARDAKLIRWRMVTEPSAVFSVRPGIERIRPPQRTSIPNLALAGDWTRTGWPSTMEGAVRSGYLAAEVILRSLGREERLLVPDLKPAFWAKLLVGASR